MKTINIKESRAIKDVFIVLTSVIIYMLAIVLESNSYETVDEFISSQNADSIPVIENGTRSSRNLQTKTTTTVTSWTSTSTVRPWPSHDFFQQVLGTTEKISANEQHSAENVSNASSNNVMAKIEEIDGNSSRAALHSEYPFEFIAPKHAGQTNNDSKVMFHKTSESTRSQLSRHWKLGIDISIAQAESNKTSNKNDNAEATEKGDKHREIPPNIVTKAELPLRIRPFHTKRPTKVKNSPQSGLYDMSGYVKVSGSHNFADDGKTIWEIRNKTTTYQVKNVPPAADYVDDENVNPFGWIDEIGDITSPPLINTPKFPPVTWPYTKQSTASKTTMLPFYIYTSLNTTRKITGRPLIGKTSHSPKTGTTKYPNRQTTIWTRVPTLTVENKPKQTIPIESSGYASMVETGEQELTSLPLRIKLHKTTEKPHNAFIFSSTASTYTIPTTTDSPEIETDPAQQFVHALFSVVTEAPEISQKPATQKSPTNIWYKPIINNYSFSNVSSTKATQITQGSTYSHEVELTTESTPQFDIGELDNDYKEDEIIITTTTKPSPITPEPTSAAPMLSTTTKRSVKYKIKTPTDIYRNKNIIFKVWNYLDGKLILQSQREIPSWLLENYEIKDGDVLNLNELPSELRDLVKETVQNSTNENEKKENRTEREQFHWQELPSVRPDEEVGDGLSAVSISSEKANNEFPSWLMKTSSDWKNPSLNYVVWNSSSIPAYILNPSAEDNTNYQQYLQEYLQYITTSRPQINQVAPVPTDSYFDKLKKQESLNRLQQILLNFMSTTPAPVKDGHPWDQIDENDLLANLASFAIIMTHLRSQYPVIQGQSQNTQSLWTTTSTTPNPYGFTPPARDHFWAAMYPLLQHLINNNNFTFIPPPVGQQQQQPLYEEPVQHNWQTLPPLRYPKTGKPVRFGVTGITRYGEVDDNMYNTTPALTGDDDDDSETEDANESESDDTEEEQDEVGGHKTKTLLTKAIVKGAKLAAGIKAVKVVKALKKKKKNKLGYLQPGTYDFSFDILGGSVYDIIKKKLTALVAIKYMPVFLVLAMGLIPIGIIFLPLAFKFIKLKMSQRYPKKGRRKPPIYVPYFPAYPQYYYPQPVHNYGWQGHASTHSHNYGHGADNYYAADNTGYPDGGVKYNGNNKEPNTHYTNHDEEDQYKENAEEQDQYIRPEEDEQWQPDFPSQVTSSNPYYSENYDDVKDMGNKGYDLGYGIGSMIGKINPMTSLGNKHDTEVLKILINNKKDMIKKLLDKWKLTKAKPSAFVPSYDDMNEEIDAVDQYARKSRRRRKRYIF